MGVVAKILVLFGLGGWLDVFDGFAAGLGLGFRAAGFVDGGLAGAAGGLLVRGDGGECG